MNAGANDTKPSGGAGTAAANVRCTRYIVEVDPAAVLCRYNALGTEDHAVLVCVFQSRQSVGDLLLGVLPGRLYAPAGEHFVCLVVVMLVIVVMAAAGAVLVMFVVVMVVMMFMFLMIMVMIVAAAGAVLVMFVVVMVVMVFMFLMVMIVVVVMIVCSGFCQQFL